MSVIFKNKTAVIDGFTYSDVGKNTNGRMTHVGETLFIDDSFINKPSIKSYIVLFSCQFGFFRPDNFFPKRILEADEKYTHFRNLPNTIINDLKTKKAKIVITIGDDGYWGSAGLQPWLNPDYTLINLNGMMRTLGLPKGSVFFVFQNQIANYICKQKNLDLVCIPFTEPSETHINRSYIDKRIYEKKEKINKLFVSYNRKGHLSRLLFLSKLIKENLLEKGNVSFLNEDLELPPEHEMWELFQCKHYSITKYDYNNLMKHTPMYLEEMEETEFEVPVSDYHGQVLNYKNCVNTFLWVVTETNVEHNVIYFSEKTFKPIVANMPFLMISSPYTLKYLKKLGYKTFDKWWDESYDNELDLDTRLNMIIQILKDLSEKTEKELLEMLEEMQSIIVHNSNLWMERGNYKNPIKKSAITKIIDSIDKLSLDEVLQKYDMSEPVTNKVI